MIKFFISNIIYIIIILFTFPYILIELIFIYIHISEKLYHFYLQGTKILNILLYFECAIFHFLIIIKLILILKIDNFIFSILKVI